MNKIIQIACVSIVAAAGLGASCRGIQDATRTVGRGVGGVGDVASIATGNLSASNKTGDYIETGKVIFDTVRLEDADRERAIGESLAVSFTNSPGVDSRDAIQKYVISVGLTVASVVPRTDLVWTFGVLDTDDVAAYSAPQGYVFVTRGALSAMQNESELAGVLAHEIAHVVKNHGMDTIKSQGYSKALMTGALAGYNSNQVVDFLKDTTETLRNSTYSQSQETSADALAIQYIAEAGYDARGYAAFLSRLNDSPRKTFDTHPRTADRVAKVNALAGAHNGGVLLADRFRQNVALGK